MTVTPAQPWAWDELTMTMILEVRFYRNFFSKFLLVNAHLQTQTSPAHHLVPWQHQGAKFFCRNYRLSFDDRLAMAEGEGENARDPPVQATLQVPSAQWLKVRAARPSHSVAFW